MIKVMATLYTKQAKRRKNGILSKKNANSNRTSFTDEIFSIYFFFFFHFHLYLQPSKWFCFRFRIITFLFALHLFSSVFFVVVIFFSNSSICHFVLCVCYAHTQTHILIKLLLFIHRRLA